MQTQGSALQLAMGLCPELCPLARLRIGAGGLGVAFQVEDVDNTLPNWLSLEGLPDGDASHGSGREPAFVVVEITGGPGDAMIVTQVANYAAAAFSFVAAALWFWSASIKVPQAFTVFVDVPEMESNGETTATGFVHGMDDLVRQLTKQSKMSGWAAICAGFAAACAALALALG